LHFAGFWLDIGRYDDFALAQEEFVTHREDFLGV
jgi:NDP-sugar pyrophosphorylase family protein